MFKIFNATCKKCNHTAEVYFKNDIGRCQKCGSYELTKLPTTTGIRTETSPSR